MLAVSCHNKIGNYINKIKNLFKYKRKWIKQTLQTKILFIPVPILGDLLLLFEKIKDSFSLFSFSCVAQVTEFCIIFPRDLKMTAYYHVSNIFICSSFLMFLMNITNLLMLFRCFISLIMSMFNLVHINYFSGKFFLFSLSITFNVSSLFLAPFVQPKFLQFLT